MNWGQPSKLETRTNANGEPMKNCTSMNSVQALSTSSRQAFRFTRDLRRRFLIKNTFYDFILVKCQDLLPRI